MDKKLFCFFLLIGIFILSACSGPLQTQSLLDENSAASTPVTEPPEEKTTSSESDLEPPHNIDGADLTLIPGATYLMGSTAADALAEEDEFPQHKVSIDEFFIYTYEVTNQMYASCVEAGSCMRPLTREVGPTSHFEDPEFVRNPVVGVDWLMARDYCAWAGGRLPTEAEWELASRGPDSLFYPWGEEEPSCDYVNMGGCLVPSDSRQVGYYLLGNSPDQVWDLSGNVWEWVQDWYDDDYYSQSPADNPLGPPNPQDPDNPQRVIRGGGFNSPPEAMRSAARMGLNPYRAFSDVGFRCVMGEVLRLPADYDPGDDRHERVPSDSVDGSDSADDPDGGHFFWGETTDGPCPDAAEMITLRFAMGSSEPPTHVLLRYEMSWWGAECDYNAATHTATCTVPAPPRYLDPPPFFRIDLCMTTPFWGECITDLEVRKPLTCDDGGLMLMRVETACTGTPGADSPILIIEPLDTAADLSFARANGVLLSCSEVEEGIYHCSGLPGSPGDDLELIVGLSDGREMAGRVIYPSCGDLGEDPPWILNSVGCLLHGSGTPEFYAVIDTFLDVTFTSWYLGGVEEPMLCAEEAVIGRWYCNFPIRDWYGRLKFCASWVGHPLETCKDFPESVFGARLPDRCEVPEEITCSDFTTPTECDRHPGMCWWDKDGGGICRPRP